MKYFIIGFLLTINLYMSAYILSFLVAYGWYRGKFAAWRHRDPNFVCNHMIDIKTHFEANMLDGDSVQNGQMIASLEVLEYILENYNLKPPKSGE